MEFTWNVATAEELQWIASLEEKQFGHDAIPLPILQEWYGANASAFVVLKCDGAKLGHIDVLPVREDAFRPFVDGAIVERDLRGAAFFTPAEHAAARDVYIESIIVLGDTREVHRGARSFLLQNLGAIIRNVAESPRHVYAMAATDAGVRFMQRWKFEVVTPAEGRVDAHPLYRTGFEEWMTRI